MAEAQADSSAGSRDVECDFCTGRKLKAVKSCLTCLVSFCEAHLSPHYQVPALKIHKLIQPSKKLQEKICSKHDEVMKIYCRTDRTCVCSLCTIDEHKGHDAVSAAAERAEKQNEIKEIQRKFQEKIQEKQEELQELKEKMNILKLSAQTAVKDSEKIFTQLIRSIEEKRHEITALIQSQEKTELSAAEDLLKELEHQISDLKRRNAELEKLSLTEDHIHFLQSFQSLRVSPEIEEPSGITVHRRPDFDGVKTSLSELKQKLEEFSTKEFVKIDLRAAKVQIPPKLKTREDFLQYFCQLTLDLNSAQNHLSISRNNRMVVRCALPQGYPNHPERFDWWAQVLSKEGMTGRCYWEAQWSGENLSIAVSYKDISRKGQVRRSGFGCGNRSSWNLQCSSPPYMAHNEVHTTIPVPVTSKIGVYMDHTEGILSFYNVSDRMTHLHTVHTTFTQPVHAGFRLWSPSSVMLCDKSQEDNTVFTRAKKISAIFFTS
ncbi:tripartite motif-containing protein 16-like [Astyanax mexicanus]|uniref:tripartite motif-containing protein 16-like n=1 Tax=Astyanax mexicanus TaxID=7994 RepID=UPI0020CB13B2|nr:tripartite motif-containing protein 16-like [Astyanax mexicanus]